MVDNQFYNHLTNGDALLPYDLGIYMSHHPARFAWTALTYGTIFAMSSGTNANGSRPAEVEEAAAPQRVNGV